MSIRKILSPNVLIENTLLTLLIFGLGFGALQIATVTGYASPVWPAAGIAIAFLTVRGSRLWLAVFLGSLLTNASLIPSLELATLFSELKLPTMIAASSTLQALVAAMLLRRFVTQPLALIDQRDIFRFLIIVLFSCCIAASGGTLALWILEKVHEDDILLNWLTWWVGDSLGSLTMVPFSLIFIGKPRSIWLTRRMLGIVLLGLLAISTLVTLYISHQEAERIASRFETEANRESLSIKSRLESYSSAMYPLAGLFSLSQAIDRSEFEHIATPLLSQYPGMMALSWVPLILDEQRAAYEQRYQHLRGADFHITAANGPGQFFPAPQKASYTPVTYIVPSDSFQRVIGFDLSSSPVRAAALAKALAVNRPAATSRIILVQENGNQYSFLLAMPVYAANHDADTGQQLPRGFITAVFRANDMLAGAHDQALDSANLRISLFDRSAAIGNQRLCEDCLQSEARALDQFDPNLQIQRTILLGERLWELVLTASKEYSVVARSWQNWLILICILLFTGFMSIFLLDVTGRQAVISRQVKSRTEELARGKERLEHSNQELSRFAHATSHDLQEPLRKISMFSGLVERAIAQGDAERATDLLRRVQNSSQRMAYMIKQLLAYAHATASTLQIEAVDLNQLLLEVQEVLELKIEENAASINMEPLPVIQADKLQISRVFQNLLSNAIDYSAPERPLIINVRTTDSDAESWHISVHDNAEGFDPKYAEKIFEAFQRLHGVTAKSGSGIGLSISRSIVNAHGGRLWAESKLGVGSVFHVKLPKSAP